MSTDKVQEVPEANDPNDITDKVVKSDLAGMTDLKKTKWEEFKNRHSARIALFPTQGGKKTLPAMWSESAQDWIWISRQHRRHLERKFKR